jgi:hypothetical protein
VPSSDVHGRARMPQDFVKHSNNLGFVGAWLECGGPDGKAKCLVAEHGAGAVRLTPQAFSHFSWCHTGGQSLIVDIQGVSDFYTDPAIHTADGQGYGDANIGPDGICSFFRTHHCSSLCRGLGLAPFDLSKAEVEIRQRRNPVATVTTPPSPTTTTTQMMGSDHRDHAEPTTVHSPHDLARGHSLGATEAHKQLSEPDMRLHSQVEDVRSTLALMLPPTGSEQYAARQPSGASSAAAKSQAVGEVRGAGVGAGGCLAAGAGLCSSEAEAHGWLHARLALHHVAKLQALITPLTLAQSGAAANSSATGDSSGLEILDVASLREAALYHAAAAGAMLGVEAPPRCCWRAEAEPDRVAWLAAKFEALGARARERQAQYAQVTADYEQTDDIETMKSQCAAAVELFSSPGVLLWPKALEDCSGRYQELQARRQALRAPPRQQAVEPVEAPPQLMCLSVPADSQYGQGERLALDGDEVVADEWTIASRRQQQLTGAVQELVLCTDEPCPFRWDWPLVNGITPRARLMEIYEHFNPRKLGDIPQLLREWSHGSKHSVDDLVKKVEAKYIKPAESVNAESVTDDVAEPKAFVGRFSRYIGMAITQLGGPLAATSEAAEPEPELEQEMESDLGLEADQRAANTALAAQAAVDLGMSTPAMSFSPPSRAQDNLLPAPACDKDSSAEDFGRETDGVLFDQQLRETEINRRMERDPAEDEPLFEEDLRESEIHSRRQQQPPYIVADAASPTMSEGTPPPRRRSSLTAETSAPPTAEPSPDTHSEGSPVLDGPQVAESMDDVGADDVDGIGSMRSGPESQWLCALSAPKAQIIPALYSSSSRPLRLQFQALPSEPAEVESAQAEQGSHHPAAEPEPDRPRAIGPRGPLEATQADSLRVKTLAKRLDAVVHKPNGGRLFVEVRNVEIDTPAGDVVWLGIYLERARCAELKGTLDSLRKLLRKMARSIPRLPDRLSDTVHTAQLSQLSVTGVPMMARARMIASAMQDLLQYGGGDGEWLQSRELRQLLNLQPQACTAFRAAATQLAKAASRAAVPSPRQVRCAMCDAYGWLVEYEHRGSTAVWWPGP